MNLLVRLEKANKDCESKFQECQDILNSIAGQLTLKLIANVTYGYTAAGFSGRMPCAELADSIVQCGRSTLEKFVLLKGRTVKESFRIGNEIASAITAMNPNPVTLKMEKVYHPCFLLTKKRYVGYSYESPEQSEPVFDAKGIETVRRDTCGAVSKTLEKSLRLFFEHQNHAMQSEYLMLLNDLYYISKQIIPALQQIFGLVGADLIRWFIEMPRPVREAFAKRPFSAPNAQQTRIDYYYLSKHCILCGELVQASAHICNQSLQKGASAAAAVIGRTPKLERDATPCCYLSTL
uniref:DNA-directed DNA polymerase n=1 Tax=Quercus lobata TaxID=97700 RepID=A0A7N2L801_QUELO